MDIFTTALTKVRPSPIKPKKLRVKALAKEPETNKLTDDPNRLEEHDLYFINEKKHLEDKQQTKKSDSDTHPLTKIQHEYNDDNIAPSDSVITDKQDILHPHKDNKDEEPEQDIQHLDLFI